MAAREKSLRSLGSDYINDFFRGAMFLDKEKNRVYKLLACERGGNAICSWIDLSQDIYSVRWTGRDVVPLWQDSDSSFSLFSWPKLGYRNIPSNVYGNVAYYIQSERSTGRGLREDTLIRLRPPLLNLSDYLYVACPYDGNSAGKAHAIYNPVWYSFKEGMKRLHDGEWLGFALNEDVAIFCSHESPDTYNFDIYFRGVLAGLITEEGHIVMKNKILSRSSLQKLLNKDK